jgi:hypothetical protein
MNGQQQQLSIAEEHRGYAENAGDKQIIDMNLIRSLLASATSAYLCD